jgi:hypothetical protein
MVLGIANDFTSNVNLDSELTTIPSNGLYLNMGVHTSITIENLLAFLPLLDITLTAWSAATTYGKYTTTRNKRDLVTVDGVVYQSLASSNINHSPTEANSVYWLATNMDSLKLKNFLFKVQDRVYSDLHLTKRLINNQKIYEVASNVQTLPNDFCGWVFEPKGSDYVSIRINQISIQKDGTTPIDLYVVNQNALVTTLSITPSNGKVDFKDLNYTFKGQGDWKFLIDSTDVYADNSCVDPLKYDGFICYTTVGVGDTVQTADYNYGVGSNGLGFDVSVYLDSQTYIDNNISDFGEFVRATFELMTLQMFLHNSNNRSNRSEKMQMDRELLIAETKVLDMNTVAKKYADSKKRALSVIDKTFDTQLYQGDDMEVEVTSL